MNGNVLLVDDNPADLLLAETVLEAQGFTVISATSGANAIKIMAQFEFSLIIIDMQMPNMSGLQLLEKLMQNESTRDLPKLMLSASGGINGVKKAIDLGAHDYLTKPIDVMLLEEKLKVMGGESGDWKEFEIGPEYNPKMGLLAACDMKSLSELSATFETSFSLKEGSVATILLKMPGWFDAGLVNARVNKVSKEGSYFNVRVVKPGFSFSIAGTKRGEVPIPYIANLFAVSNLPIISMLIIKAVFLINSESSLTK